MAQLNVQHHAPAGRTYPSIQHAGRSTLEKYCDNYPNTTSSYILPNLFPSSFPEVIDNPPASLTEKQKRRFDGFMGNLRGERSEYEVYLAFTSLTRKPLADPILVLWGTKFDSDNKRAMKRKLLMWELPSIDIGPGEMSQEKDFIIFVRNLGVVFAEVKRSATQVNIDKAEEQLNNAEKSFKKIMFAISRTKGTVLPTSKLVLIPGESESSPATKTPYGSHLVYNNLIQNFQVKWSEVVSELKQTNALSPINSSDFEKLVQFITGVWSMRPFEKKFFQFKSDEASLASNVQNVDKHISDAVLCSEKGDPFSSNVPTSSVTKASYQDGALNVLYFSPQQKLIFDDYPHALIRAPAGCGKSLLILMKIIDILEKDPAQLILLIAAKPHHLRCKNILERNNITVEIFPLFPYTLPSPPTPFPPSSQVVIVELQNFLEVPRKTLLAYDLSLFNVLVDDLHAYFVPDKDILDKRGLPYEGKYSNYIDIGDFIDYTYSVAKWNNMFCWFGMDAAQQVDSRNNNAGHQNVDHIFAGVRNFKAIKATGLFLTKSGSKRLFNIPVVVIDQVLRNSKEIVGVLESARKEQAKCLVLDTSIMVQNVQCGHHITSQKVLYHKMDIHPWNEELRIRFVCERINELFSTLSSSSTSSSSSSPSSSSTPSSFDLPSVAILFEFEQELSLQKSALEQLLLTSFKLHVQTIEQQLITNNHTSVVLDYVDNIQSFETPVLVYVRTGYGGLNIWLCDDGCVYNIISRARTICVVVDVGPNDPLPLQNIDVVEWEETDGVFTELN